MRFVQTLYFDASIDPLKASFGWVAPEYHLMGWALSCLQLRQFYPNVHFYGNSAAAELLVGDLQLPYTSVHNSHNTLEIPNESLWALPKIFTYSLQKQPFLHVDGDVFLFNNLPIDLLEGELIAQNREQATEYYLSSQRELMKHFSFFPDCVREDFFSDIPIKAVNAGILGGKNIDFIREYTSLAFEYIHRNAEKLPLVSSHKFNVFFEQHLFYSLAQKRRVSVNFLFEETTPDNQYEGLGDFHEVPFKKFYCHLLGHYKKDKFTCMQMAAKLRQLYPEYYYRIIALFNRRGIALEAKLYNTQHFSGAGNYVQLQHRCINHYSKPKVRKRERSVTDVAVDVCEPQDLRILQQMISNYDYGDKPFTPQQLQNDFDIFSTKLKEVIEINEQYDQEYLYGRDLGVLSWYSDLFENENSIHSKTLICCNEFSIIKSAFDWAGLLNKQKRAAVRYYLSLELANGEFNNLVVPELFEDGFSLHDLDETEKIILSYCDRPITVENLLVEMNNYVDEEIIQHHLGEYQTLIVHLLKQLVLKKAIKPYKS